MSQSKNLSLYKDNTDGWIKVTNGLKLKKNAKNSVVSTNTDKVYNKFVLPKHLEKKLHQNAAIDALFNESSNNVNKNKAPDEPSKKQLRCYKKNQRRNEKRRRQRLERETKSQNEVGSGTVIDTASCNESNFLCLPPEIWDDNVLPFLTISELSTFRQCNKQSKSLSDRIHHWQNRFKIDFPSHGLEFQSDQDYKLAYKVHKNEALENNRCSQSKKTFFEDIIGIGLNYTVNPKTKKVDYIDAGQDLISVSIFKEGKKSDAFGNKFKLFLPLYFSNDHFGRALPLIMSTIMKLCPEESSFVFDPKMILDVLPKIINTFAVLVSDEGVAASNKSFIGLLRIYRLFLALTDKYPIIRKEAILRIQKFKLFCSKETCPSLGNFLPLLMIIDQDGFDWTQLRSSYISESLTRSVLWICRKYPQLERSIDSTPDCVDERLELSLEAAQVGMRLNMLQVHFTSFLSQGSNVLRALRVDNYLFSKESDSADTEEKESPNSAAPEEHEADIKSSTLSCSSELKFVTFRNIVNEILCVNSWSKYFEYMRAPCPSKRKMSAILRHAVHESARKKYHTPGMDFSKVHASGTSSILFKGQQYNTKAGLQRVIFQDDWTFDGHVKYLDATCLVYKEKKLVEIIDYSRRIGKKRAIVHSGDVIAENSGSHTIEINLSRLDGDTCIFVLSAWAQATLFDIKSASISFNDADADGSTNAALCSYNLDAHDKIAHLKSIIMCKLYKTAKGNWHVLAIGDSHRGSVDNYAPIYDAAKRYLSH